MTTIEANAQGTEAGMTGQYAAIWNALNAVISAKTADTKSAEAEVQAYLATLDGQGFDPARVQQLVARLDNVTTPAAVVLPTAPNVGALDYTSKVLPTIVREAPDVPDAPGERALMDFGTPPTLDTAGDPVSMEEYRRLMLSERDALLAMVQEKFREFVAEFMPTQVTEAAQWLSDAIHARNTGIPIQVEAQIHERNRARIHKETARLIATAKTTWASKGYAVPPGALVGTVADLRRDALEQLSTTSRELAIYVSDKHIENARQAVEQTLNLRVQATNAALDYMKSLIVSPQQVGDWITAMIDNRTKVAQARADIFKTRADVASDVYRAQTGSDVERFKTLADISLEDARQGNATQVEIFRALLAQDQQAAQLAIEKFRARSGTDMEAYKVTTDALLRYYEAETRVAALKADVIGKTADTSMKLEELQFTQHNQIAKIRADLAMEKLKTYAQQASAALNNLQMQASSNTTYSISTRA